MFPLKWLHQGGSSPPRFYWFGSWQRYYSSPTILYKMVVDAAIVHRKRSKREVPGWVMMVGSSCERWRTYSMLSFPSKRVKFAHKLGYVNPSGPCLRAGLNFIYSFDRGIALCFEFKFEIFKFDVDMSLWSFDRVNDHRSVFIDVEDARLLLFWHDR